ncbi:hypothetical protein MM213_02125 [Belliella sp. R4-6]|uniref:CRISPR associated protein Cas6 C-terminal domain-containing protein n=1 Tax=Belliella alkalica TaxID=1730871 RepID=A0ABS9V773_9BACT|nr:CRISPR-associated endoribonuclease Cas6 [Belliella alkalica]MCH7412266.1 hypothetical protein [Belliella alkalica]
MQFLIKLKRGSSNNKISRSYQYQLSAALENILEQADKSSMQSIYGDQACSKRFYPFTFSNLDFDFFLEDIESELFTHIGENASLDMRILVDSSTCDYIVDLLKGQRINFVSSNEIVEYSIHDLEEIPKVDFKDEMIYKAVTPVFLVNKTDKGEMDYVSPNDIKYAGLFKNQLLKKFSSFFPELKKLQKLEDYCPEIVFEPISEIQKRGVVFNDFETDPIKLTAYQYDFKLIASPLLQELGYYGGFGTQNSLGFGCVSVKNLS